MNSANRHDRHNHYDRDGSTHDNLDRTTKELWKSLSGASIHSIHYAYDNAGMLDTVRELRGSQSGTPLLEYDFAYDKLDRLTSVVDTANTAANINIPSTLPTVAVTLSDTYKTNGDLKQSFAKIGSVADYSNVFSYDNLGRLTQVVQRQFTSGEQTTYGATSTNTITRKRVNLAYNAAGQFSKIIRMSGASGAETETATSVYAYFNGGAVKQIEHWHSGAAAASTAPTSLGSSISSYSWTYDTHGRAASFTAPEGTFAYGYDVTHELISATFTVASGYTGGTPATENFSFDNTGNRTGGGNSVNKNRLLSDGTYNYTYDGEGNRTSRTHISTGQYVLYSWDHRNRLTRVEFRNTSTGPATKIVANTYDAFDRRVMKQVDDNADGTFDRTERYVWDGDQISLVLNASGTVLQRFLHGPAIDQVFASEDSGNGLLWDLGDHQNTTRDVIDTSGTVVNHLTYSPFGIIASESDATKTPFAAYTGRDWDEDLNLQYNRGRWYEPATGRWLSEDPIGFSAGDTNLHRYVGNDPNNFVDPSGEDGEASNRLPSDDRGIWLRNRDRNRLDSKPAKKGDGWFHFKDKTLKPVKYVDGRPDFEASGLVMRNRTGKPVTVNIGALDDLGDDAVKRQKHFDMADAKMRETNPGWKKPEDTTWHHASTDGTMQLVAKAEHNEATHTGSIADQKMRSRADADSVNCAKNKPKASSLAPDAPTPPKPHGPRSGGLLRGMGRANMFLDFFSWPLDYWRISREAEANGRTFDEQVDAEIKDAQFIMPGMVNPFYDYRNNPI